MFCNINHVKMLTFSKLPEKMHNNRCLTGTLTVVVLSNLKAFVCPFSRYTFKTFGRKRREFPWWSNVTGVIVVRREFILIEALCLHRKNVHIQGSVSRQSLIRRSQHLSVPVDHHLLGKAHFNWITPQTSPLLC